MHRVYAPNPFSKPSYQIIIHSPLGLASNCIPIRPMHRSPYITVQGIGMQQHSNPSHSIQKDFVPPAPPSGFTMEEMVEEAAEPGPLRFTRVEEVEVHILAAL